MLHVSFAPVNQSDVVEYKIVLASPVRRPNRHRALKSIQALSTLAVLATTVNSI